MDEILTISEIESRYPGEWVLVEDPETDEALEVLSGKVLCHSPNRDEVDRKAMELRPRDFAFLFFGDIPDDLEVILRASVSTCREGWSSYALDYGGLARVVLSKWRLIRARHRLFSVFRHWLRLATIRLPQQNTPKLQRAVAWRRCRSSFSREYAPWSKSETICPFFVTRFPWKWV